MDPDTAAQDISSDLEEEHVCRGKANLPEDFAVPSPGDLISLSPEHDATQPGPSRHPADPFLPSTAEHGPTHAAAHAGQPSAGRSNQPGVSSYRQLAGRHQVRGSADAGAKENARPLPLALRAAWNAGSAAHAPPQGRPRKPASAAALHAGTVVPRTHADGPPGGRGSVRRVSAGGLAQGQPLTAVVRRVSGPATAAEAKPRAGAVQGATASDAVSGACRGGAHTAAAPGALVLRPRQRAGLAAPAERPACADDSAGGAPALGVPAAAAQLAHLHHQLRLKARLVEELRAHKRQLAGAQPEAAVAVVVPVPLRILQSLYLIDRDLWWKGSPHTRGRRWLPYLSTS